MADGIRYRSQFTDNELSQLGPVIQGAVYEFFGDYWHGHQALINKYVEKNKEDKAATIKTRLTQTYEKLKKIISMGYAVKVIWEKDFRYGNSDIWQDSFIPPLTRRYLTAIKPDTKRAILEELSTPEKFQQLLKQHWTISKTI